MYTHSHFYPSYIKDLIAELESSPFGDAILMKYHMKTISDPVLSRIYTSFHFPEFHEIPSNEVIQKLSNEYLEDFPRIDSDSEGLKVGFTRIFYDNQINFLSDPSDFGLELQKSEIFEATSLNTLWSEDTSSSPIKIPGSVKVPKTTQRSKNGLKVLSWKVKEIVQRLGSSTYQEVADILVKETEEEVEGAAKDEKNIRRRVYDALNVLIAVGVLQKNNKKVEPLARSESPAVEKLKKLKEIAERYLMIKALVERNREAKESVQAVYLPFTLVVVGRKTEKPARVQANFQSTGVSIRVDQEFLVHCSEDFITKINIEINYSELPVQLYSLFNLHIYDNSILF